MVYSPKLYRGVSNPSKTLAIQADLDAAVRWADKWQLTFNSSKCKALHIGRQNRHHVYTLQGDVLEDAEVEKDLGIYMNQDLKFGMQAATAVSKASQVMAAIHRSFQLLDKSTMSVLYMMLVRPHLKYGNIVRTRRVTKLIAELHHLQR